MTPLKEIVAPAGILKNSPITSAIFFHFQYYWPAISINFTHRGFKKNWHRTERTIIRGYFSGHRFGFQNRYRVLAISVRHAVQFHVINLKKKSRFGSATPQKGGSVLSNNWYTLCAFV